MKKDWYSVRALFYDEGNKFYEERTILVMASSGAEALDKGESDAHRVESNLGDVKYAGYAETFKIVDEDIGDVIEYCEVFSCMRYSNLNAKDYVKRFLETGDEVNLTKETQ